MSRAATEKTAQRWPLVSVVVPCYRSGKFLESAVASILAQKYPRVEVIVVNQGGDAETEESVGRVGALPNVKVVAREKRNAAFARNCGLQLADGDYVAFLDADDAWFAGFLSAVVEKAVAHDLDCVFGETVLVNDALRPLGTRLSADIGLATFLDFRACPIHINSVLVKRRVMKEVGGFDDAMGRGEDWDVLQRIARTGRIFVKASGALAYYRIHAHSTTADYAKHARDLIDGVGRRVFGRDEKCPTSAVEFSEGMGSALYHLEMLPRRIQESMLTVLAGALPPSLQVSRALFLHWYRQQGAFESLVLGTVARFYRSPADSVRDKIIPLIPRLGKIFSDLVTEEELQLLGLPKPEARLVRAVEPELLRDLRLVLGYLGKGLRKYRQRFWLGQRQPRPTSRTV